MRKNIKVIIVLFLLCSLLFRTITADDSAQEHYQFAVKLNMIGLFRGTGIGFELDREATRLEGAVMFVRLLGAEDEALEEKYPHPFKDVPEWGSPYVGYLYEYKLTNGISDDEYGTTMPIKAISYLTFALRALGYSDDGSNKDFDWSGACEFALSENVIDFQMYSDFKEKTFLRDHVAWVSYELLKAKIKNEDITLIERLIEIGAVRQEDAEAVGLFNSPNEVVLGAAIGQTYESVFNSLGQWGSRLFSRYGFDWLIYNSDYNNYIQIGIEMDEVVGILAVAEGFSYESGVRIGMNRMELVQVYGDSQLTEIRKPVPGENKIIIFSLSNENKSTYKTSDGDYITYYFDSYEDDKIVAILVIDDVTEEKSIESFWPTADENLYDSLEIQVFDLTNAIRVQKGLTPLLWSQETQIVSRLHSKDMADRDYFAHDTLEGISFAQRLDNGGINYVSAGENIAAGYRDSIHMVNDWLNSATGHRDILLGDFKYIGVGIWVNSDSRLFGTQDYWK